MIIAFYPGSGGNRFFKYINGLTEFEKNSTYDRKNPYQIYGNRYLDAPVDCQIIFTHNMNVPHLKSVFPSQTEIYIIAADLKNSLMRQWELRQKHISKNQHPVGGPFSAICWHADYYKQYPYEPADAVVVDINSGIDIFSTSMRSELDSITSPEFDFAWDVYTQHGNSAPILTLFDEQFKR